MIPLKRLFKKLHFLLVSNFLIVFRLKVRIILEVFEFKFVFVRMFSGCRFSVGDIGFDMVVKVWILIMCFGCWMILLYFSCVECLSLCLTV